MNTLVEEVAELELDTSRIPSHVAVIMDGNRRWAKRRGLPALVGHWKGAETLIKIVRAASRMGVKVLTTYSFSTENWKRSRREVEGLMRLFKTNLIRQRRAMIAEGVKLGAIGDLAGLPPDVRAVLTESIDATKHGNKIELVLALNYGGRDELKRAIGAIVDDCLAGKISKGQVSEEMIARYLDTAAWKDPNLLIRTSGESRLSNFLLWQISYSEMVIMDVLWPDFSETDLHDALLEYQRREHRLGV